MADQKDLTPKLITPDGPKPTQITREELFDLLKPTGQSEAQMATMATLMAEAMAKAVTTAVTEAQNAIFDKMSGESKYGEWNIANFPDRSVFNPQGENPALLPRPALNGDVLWVGTPMDERENTRFEIDYANQLEAGIFHSGKWIVTDLAPGQGKRALLVVFPCVEPDHRAALPSGYFDRTEKRHVTGMEVMLREMVEEAASKRAARAVA